MVRYTVPQKVFKTPIALFPGKLEEVVCKYQRCAKGEEVEGSTKQQLQINRGGARLIDNPRNPRRSSNCPNLKCHLVWK